ncbi:MAG: sulfatase-like hydrolase/transferase [Planctomycetota bacterium]
MNRLLPLCAVATSVLLFAGCARTPTTPDRIETAAKPRPPRPNVVLIVCDDAGYADFGFTTEARAPGSEVVATPRLDELANSGVVLERAYVAASVCSPSRAALLTGRYPQRFGHEFNLPYRKNEPLGLPLSEQTIADRLRARGYACGAFGKWHLGVHAGYRPLDRGFDVFSGLLGGSRSYFAQEGGATAEPRPRAWMQDHDPIADPEGSYVTDRIADGAIEFIQSHASEPFFAYVAFTAPHTPMHALESDLDAVGDSETPERRRALLALMRSLDRSVGSILDALNEAGVSDRTLIWFINDNGGATNNGSDNGILRGMKGSKWEGGVRVPAVVRWPGVVRPGTRDRRIVSALDILPTALAATGTPAPRAAGLDGIDLAPRWRDERAGDDRGPLFWRRGPAAAVLDGNWKLIRVEDNPPLLFDLATDPGETVNLSETKPELAAKLLRQLAVWEQGLVEPLWDTGERWRKNQVRKHRLEVRGRAAERKLP